MAFSCNAIGWNALFLRFNTQTRFLYWFVFRSENNTATISQFIEQIVCYWLTYYCFENSSSSCFNDRFCLIKGFSWLENGLKWKTNFYRCRCLCHMSTILRYPKIEIFRLLLGLVCCNSFTFSKWNGKHFQPMEMSFAHRNVYMLLNFDITFLFYCSIPFHVIKRMFFSENKKFK